MRSACVPRIKLCFTYLHKWTGCLDSACNSKHKRTSHGGLPSWGCICSPESWFWKSRQRFVQSEVLPRTFLVNNLGMGPSISQRSAFTPLRPYYTQVDPPNLPYSKFFCHMFDITRGPFTIHVAPTKRSTGGDFQFYLDSEALPVERFTFILEEMRSQAFWCMWWNNHSHMCELLKELTRRQEPKKESDLKSKEIVFLVASLKREIMKNHVASMLPCRMRFLTDLWAPLEMGFFVEVFVKGNITLLGTNKLNLAKGKIVGFFFCNGKYNVFFGLIITTSATVTRNGCLAKQTLPKSLDSGLGSR